MNQTLQYGDAHIAYRVFFVPKMRHKIAIHVHPDGSVQVDAPEATSMAEVKAAVAQKARWLSAQLDRIDRRHRHLSPREYVSGESHLYLGRRYLLKVLESSHETAGVKLRCGQLQVTTGHTDGKSVKSLLWHWYRCHAHTLFEQRLEGLCRELSWVGNKPNWRLLPMKKQWGSCSPKGVISVNTHLIKAPAACIDYVLLHELCHLKWHNHGPGFYRLLRSTMPEWESVKNRLDGMAELLLNE